MFNRFQQLLSSLLVADSRTVLSLCYSSPNPVTAPPCDIVIIISLMVIIIIFLILKPSWKRGWEKIKKNTENKLLLLL